MIVRFYRIIGIRTNSVIWENNKTSPLLPHVLMLILSLFYIKLTSQILISYKIYFHSISSFI